MSTEEKVASEATIEVLHQRTSPDRLLGQRDNLKLNRMEPAPELFSDGRFLGPAAWIAVVARSRPEQTPQQFRGNLQFLSPLLQIDIELVCEGE